MLSKTIGIIDYGIGNIKSVVNTLDLLGYNSLVSNNPLDFKNLKKILLVGVGSYDLGMRNLIKHGFDKFLIDFVLKGGHIFGICLGFQILFEKGTENNITKGLNLVKGTVESINLKNNLKVPHIGWNNLNSKNFKNMKLLKDIDIESNFYFVHSYFANPTEEINKVTTNYLNLEFCSMIEKDDKIYGTQFHPEKSQLAGMKIFSNFYNI